MLSDLTVNAILVAVPATILSLATLVTSVKGVRKTDVAIQQNEVLKGTTERIESAADGNLSRVTKELKAAKEEIQAMKKLIGVLEKQWGRGPVLAADDEAMAREADEVLKRLGEPK